MTNFQKYRSAFAQGTQDGKQLLRKNVKGAFRIVSLFVANILGVGAGLMLATLMGIPGAAEERAFPLFLLGATNGWLLCMLYSAITGKKRRKRKRR